MSLSRPASVEGSRPTKTPADAGAVANAWHVTAVDFAGSTSYTDTQTFTSGGLTWTARAPAGSPTIATTGSGLSLATDGAQDCTAAAKACPSVTTPYSGVTSDPFAPVAIVLSTSTALSETSVSSWGIYITDSYATSNPREGRIRCLFASGNHQYQVHALQGGSTGGGSATTVGAQIRAVCIIRQGSYVRVFTNATAVASEPAITDILAGNNGWTELNPGSLVRESPIMGNAAEPFDPSTDLIGFFVASANASGNSIVCDAYVAYYGQAA